MDAARPALAGVKVVDLTQFEAGTSCTETLAWLGADVIKVEEPTQGDQGRRASSEQPGVDSYYFMLLNANKRSVTCNLKDEGGKELLCELIEARRRLHRELRARASSSGSASATTRSSEINPRIIYAQIKGFAPDGPYGNFLAFDMIAQSVGGALAITGERGPAPAQARPDHRRHRHRAATAPSASWPRCFSVRSPAGASASKWRCRKPSSTSRRIAYGSQLLWGKPAPRNGNRSVLGTSAPSEAYPCKGGGPNDYCYIYTTRAGNHQWQRLLQVIGREDLLEDPRFATRKERLPEHRRGGRGDHRRGSASATRSRSWRRSGSRACRPAPSSTPAS